MNRIATIDDDLVDDEDDDAVLEHPLAARRSPTNWAFAAREIGTGEVRHLV